MILSSVEVKISFKDISFKLQNKTMLTFKSVYFNISTSNYILINSDEGIMIIE